MDEASISMDNSAQKNYISAMKTLSNFSLLHYVIQLEAQEMLSRFSSLLNVRLGFFSPGGEEICIGQGRPICAYCQSMRADCGMEPACKNLDRRMFARARRAKRPFSYGCHAGLTDALVPIDLDGRRIGLLMVGQFRISGQTIPAVSGDWKTTRQALEKKYRATPLFSRPQAEDMLRMLELMARYIVDHHLISRRDADLIQPLLDALDKDSTLTLSVGEAAALVGRSPSGFAHLFKRLTGRGFIRFQTDRKMEEAGRLLKAFPQMPVKEVSERIGIADPLYFSRVYRKLRGCPPSAARLQPEPASIS
jgi:AraC-like DNA-binding protein